MTRRSSFQKHEENSSPLNGKFKAADEKHLINKNKSKIVPLLQNSLKRVKPNTEKEIDISPDLQF